MLGVLHSLSQTECMEYPIGFQTDVVVGGHQGIVCVNGRGLFVIVAGTHLCDIGNFRTHFFGDQAKLAVYFQVVQSVDDAAAGIFQTAGPFNVVFLVEPSPQFYQNHYVLAVFCRFDQGFYNFTVGSNAVQGHFNGNDLRISAGFVQQGEERADAFVGECQKTVLFLYLFDHAFGYIPPCRLLRNPSLIEQALVVAEHIPYHRQYREIQRSFRVEYLFFCQIQVVTQ